MYVIVLNDGTTFSDLSGARILDLDDGIDDEDVEWHLEDIERSLLDQPPKIQDDRIVCEFRVSAATGKIVNYPGPQYYSAFGDPF